MREALGGIPFTDLNGHLPLDDNGLPKIVAEVGRNRTQIDAWGRPQCDVGAMTYLGRSADYHRYDCPALRADADHPCVLRPKGCFGASAHVRVAMAVRHGHLTEVPEELALCVADVMARCRVERAALVSWDADLARFVRNAIGPVPGLSVIVAPDRQRVRVEVPSRWIGLALGVGGLNLWLAQRLTAVRIDVDEAEARVR